ncbi:DUF4017 family protein [Kurthia gibsonii]|uniref:DUF4017 family protein n=1 Tax=Kurthia gibsonii TaxID=33946 RepID=UPI0030D5C1B1
MKKLGYAFIVYLIACGIIILLPASPGYDVWSWKLLVGQVYAIPAFIITLLILYFLGSKKTFNH